jgi:hypothetical protein
VPRSRLLTGASARLARVTAARTPHPYVILQCRVRDNISYVALTRRFHRVAQLVPLEMLRRKGRRVLSLRE